MHFLHCILLFSCISANHSLPTLYFASSHANYAHQTTFFPVKCKFAVYFKMSDVHETACMHVAAGEFSCVGMQEIQD